MADILLQLGEQSRKNVKGQDENDPPRASNVIVCQTRCRKVDSAKQDVSICERSIELWVSIRIQSHDVMTCLHFKLAATSRLGY